MLINGEKYACEACVRGHRVSSCTHSDRKLLHVNKKGRPVSQCQHCRSLRKARSQHVKCECHDKAHAKEDCPHLKSETALHTLESGHVGKVTDNNTVQEPHTCCCGHGARCNCSLKKEHLDAVPEDFPQVIQPKEPHKHRISSLNNHEGKPTIFSNGHHKPVHKINDAHNHCGAPYRVPSRSHTVHGHRDIAQRSTDSLPIMKMPFQHTDSPLQTSITSAPREARKTKSEHNSPELGPVVTGTDRAFNDFQIPPLDPNAYSFSPFECQSPALQAPHQQEHLPDNIPDSWFTTYDEAHTYGPISNQRYSETPPVDWATFDFNGTQPTSHGSFSPSTPGFMGSQMPYTSSLEQLNFGSLPRMNSSSGEISEAEDNTTLSRPSNLRTVSNASHDLSSPGDDFSENHRLSSTSSMFGTPQANMLAGTLDNLDIDEYVKQTIAVQKRLDSQTSVQTQPQINQSQSPLTGDGSPFEQSPPKYVDSPLNGQLTPPKTESPQPANKTSMGYIMPTNPFGPEHAFTISEAQAYAHMRHDDGTQPHNRTSPLARTSLTEDPMWSGITDDATAFKLDDPREDEDWVR